MTDYKQLCAELLQGLDENRHPEVRYPGHLRIIMARARAALTEPESPLAPGEIDLAQRARAIVSHWDNHPGSPDSSGNLKAELTGSPADDEMAELATAEMVRQLRTKAATEKANRCHYSAKLLTRAAELLERLSPPQPVPVLPEGTPIIEPTEHTLLVPVAQPIPVSERLPGPEDCNADEEVWAWRRFDPEGDMDNGDHWCLAFHEWLEDEDCGFTHWLPAHALPLPNNNTSRSNYD